MSEPETPSSGTATLRDVRSELEHRIEALLRSLAAPAAEDPARPRGIPPRELVERVRPFLSMN